MDGGSDLRTDAFYVCVCRDAFVTFTRSRVCHSVNLDSYSGSKSFFVSLGCLLPSTAALDRLSEIAEKRDKRLTDKKWEGRKILSEREREESDESK